VILEKLRKWLRSQTPKNQKEAYLFFVTMARTRNLLHPKRRLLLTWRRWKQNRVRILTGGNITKKFAVLNFIANSFSSEDSLSLNEEDYVTAQLVVSKFERKLQDMAAIAGYRLVKLPKEEGRKRKRNNTNDKV